ncbi:hypothetical protein [Mycolicibacterium mageritense]|nr:hypothetical protein [Mycolicibacterium mageritense]
MTSPKRHPRVNPTVRKAIAGASIADAAEWFDFAIPISNVPR